MSNLNLLPGLFSLLLLLTKKFFSHDYYCLWMLAISCSTGLLGFILSQYSIVLLVARYEASGLDYERAITSPSIMGVVIIISNLISLASFFSFVTYFVHLMEHILGIFVGVGLFGVLTIVFCYLLDYFYFRRRYYRLNI